MSEQLIRTPGTFGENGNFLLERELGTGGMGGVYMGRDKMLDRPVAVKVMLKEFGADAVFVEKFKKEAQSAARLIHPNIAQVYSYGICDGMPYIAMELAAGGSLYSIMTTNPGKADVARVLKICQQVAQALQCASDQGCVHGDVKPENILLDANGNAKLVDFGLAAMQKDTSEIWGTPYYISPEKVKKEQIDFRADMYSLGGTLYHALTGVAPFEGEDSVAVVRKRFEGMPKKPSEIRPDLTPAVDSLVMKMLAINREDRFPSFEALIETIRSVLTTGLTGSSAPQEKKSATGTGVKKPTSVRGRRMMVRRPGATTVRRKPELDGDDDGDAPVSPRSMRPRPESDEDEEEGGSLGLKVVGIVIGAILLVGGVIGGLVWYQVADRNARAAETHAQIADGIDKARGAIRDTVVSAEKFVEEFDQFAAKAVEACQKSTDELTKILPPEQGALLKPGPTQELLDAIAATNAPPVVAGDPGATNAVPSAATNSMAAAVAVTVTNATSAVSALPQFRPPNEDEMDPASPEGEAYLKEKKAFQAEQLKKLAEKKQGKSEGADGADSEKKDSGQGTTDAPEKTDPKKPEQTPQVVIAMNELWVRAYGCQASALRIRLAVRQVISKADEAEEVKEPTKEGMEKLGELSRTLVEMFDQVKTSKDVENVRKGITFIRSKGEKTVEQTVKRLRIEKLEAERKAKAEAAAAAEKARLEKMEAERKARIESETTEIKGLFDKVVSQGCLRQLDWKSALRQLETRKADFTTPEGQLAADVQIRKVNDMKKVHDLFIKGLPNHVFKGNKLKGAKVTEVNEKEIRLLKSDGKTKMKISWQKFYKDCPGNLNELMNLFVVNARQPTAKNRLNLREWADAMTGAALTMQLVCSEVTGAVEKAETLAKETVKAFPDYQKTAQEIFPDIKFDEAAATEE